MIIRTPRHAKSTALIVTIAVFGASGIAPLWAVENGQQDDVWDADTDMLLATLGSLAAYPVVRTVFNARD